MQSRLSVTSFICEGGYCGEANKVKIASLASTFPKKEATFTQPVYNAAFTHAGLTTRHRTENFIKYFHVAKLAQYLVCEEDRELFHTACMKFEL